MLDVLFILLALASAFFWWRSSTLSFNNKKETKVIDAFGEPQFNVTNPDELMDFFSKQSKLNSCAALCAAFAAIIGALIAIFT